METLAAHAGAMKRDTVEDRDGGPQFLLMLMLPF